MNAVPESEAFEIPPVVLEEFESAALNPEAFDHPAHVFVAWSLLEQGDLPEATQRFTSALKRLTRQHGIEGKYHETISCFYMALIAERRALQGRQDWPLFSRANPDLLIKSGELLKGYYSTERLQSPLARRQFLLPDRVPDQESAPVHFPQQPSQYLSDG